MRIFFAVPSYLGLADAYGRPRQPHFYKSMEGSIQALTARGHSVRPSKYEGDGMIQHARNELVKLFIESGDDVLMFLDDDLSWNPADLVRLIEKPDDVIGVAYRKKVLGEQYPVVINLDDHGDPIYRNDGCVSCKDLCTGFMKITRRAIERMQAAHPEQEYEEHKTDGSIHKGYWDLFPQGIYNRRWYGEDFAFCRLWREAGGEIWIMPDVNITHHGRGTVFVGNYAKYLRTFHEKTSAVPVPA